MVSQVISHVALLVALATQGSTLPEIPLSRSDVLPNDAFLVKAHSVASPDVHNGIAVNVSGLAISGTDAGDYTFTSPTGLTGDITPALLTVTAFDVTMTYADGTTLDPAFGFFAAGLQANDAIDSVTIVTDATLSGSGNWNAGTWNINVSGATGANFNANDYSTTYVSGSLEVDPQNVTVNGVTASDKIYDGTTTATIGASGATLFGTMSGDDVTLNSSGVSGDFTTSQVGDGLSVNISNLSLLGADAGNYTLLQPIATANITPAAPVLTWANPADITYGTPLSATQLDATANVPGSFDYTPAAGTILNVGNAQALDVTFTPDDSTDYTTGSQTVYINVLGQNHAPLGSDNTVSAQMNYSYTFAAADFGFSDPNDSPSNNFKAVKISAAPAVGTGALTDGGLPVNSGDIIPVADINTQKLVYTPPTGAAGIPYTTFTFQVQDDGGTANSGANTDPNPKTMTINVASIPINHAPIGTSKTIDYSGNSYTLATSAFGFTDPNDSPANNFKAVEITSLPSSSAGELTDGGSPVTAGEFIPVTDVDAGDLTFNMATDGTPTPSASFEFQVEDDGGTANGGKDTDQNAKMLVLLNTPLPSFRLVLQGGNWVDIDAGDYNGSQWETNTNNLIPSIPDYEYKGGALPVVNGVRRIDNLIVRLTVTCTDPNYSGPVSFSVTPLGSGKVRLWTDQSMTTAITGGLYMWNAPAIPGLAGMGGVPQFPSKVFVEGVATTGSGASTAGPISYPVNPATVARSAPLPDIRISVSGVNFIPTFGGDPPTPSGQIIIGVGPVVTNSFVISGLPGQPAQVGFMRQGNAPGANIMAGYTSNNRPGLPGAANSYTAVYAPPSVTGFLNFTQEETIVNGPNGSFLFDNGGAKNWAFQNALRQNLPNGPNVPAGSVGPRLDMPDGTTPTPQNPLPNYIGPNHRFQQPRAVANFIQIATTDSPFLTGAALQAKLGLPLSSLTSINFTFNFNLYVTWQEPSGGGPIANPVSANSLVLYILGVIPWSVTFHAIRGPGSSVINQWVQDSVLTVGSFATTTNSPAVYAPTANQSANIV